MTSHITLVFRRKQEIGSAACLPHFTHDALSRQHGLEPNDLSDVSKLAANHGLLVTSVHAGARCVTLEGNSDVLTHLFGVDDHCSYTAIPAELAGKLIAVLGFDRKPIASSGRKMHAAGPAGFTPLEVARLYNFPSNEGEGQTIALIELGGGFRPADLDRYWKGLGLPAVSVEAVSVDGIGNLPSGDSNSADGEVVLDIEVAGAAAPAAKIVVYFAPNTDQGFLNAINAAIHDTKRKPSVISISWGSAEKEWSAQAMDAFNAAFHDAALLGITVCAAAGDNGSSDGEQDRASHVDFPASSPWVLACGGTRLIAANGKILKETVWNNGTASATGGGVSTHFSKPDYQANVKVPAPSKKYKNTGGRGVPDVAALADPETGFRGLVDGQEGVVGGTSAVAPLWAALIALCNEQLGRNLGWFHPVLYGTVAQHKVLHDITSGTNGAYHASIGWDCCTGLGTPDGVALLNVLKKS